MLTDQVLVEIGQSWGNVKIRLRYSKFDQSKYATVERKAEGGIFIMWWTAELIKGHPHPVYIVVFLPPCNMLEHAVSLVTTGDQSEVPNHLQWGLSLCTAVYWDGSAWLWRLQRVNFREKDTSDRTLLFFYLFQSAVCKRQWLAVCRLAYIHGFMLGDCEKFPTEP